MKAHVLASACALALLSSAGHGDTPRRDFEIARDAVARGEILPLAEVLARLQTVHPGRVIEVELEISDDKMVYEVELVTPDGRLIEVELDAATAKILDYEEEDPS
jgi:uncharacterized membrane protein YkoI